MAYWSPQMPYLVDHGQAIPLEDVRRLQKSFVRYSHKSEAVQSAEGWQSNLSTRTDDSGAEVKGASEATLAASTCLPESVALEIVQAPAEFCVPVKQDRRLKPPFTVRVSVAMRPTTCFSIAVTAHIVSEQEYQMLQRWMPAVDSSRRASEMVDRGTPSELKGNESTLWRFHWSNDFSDGRAKQGDVKRLVTHDYEFPKLEFSRPSRMEKVFVVFACELAGADVLYAAFAVPTICVCRREQKEKAYVKLGIPYRAAIGRPLGDPAPDAPPAKKARSAPVATLAAPPAPQPVVAFAPAPAQEPQLRGADAGVSAAAAVSAVAAAVPQQLLEAFTRVDSNALAARQASPHEATGPAPPGTSHEEVALRALTAMLPPEIRDQLIMFQAIQRVAAAACSLPQAPTDAGLAEADVATFISTTYSALGFRRQLTQLDVAALLELAGFTHVGNDKTDGGLLKSRPQTITGAQFEKFKPGWTSVLECLRMVEHLWDVEDPPLVCGFEVDHYRAVAAMRAQPCGTFITRFSLSQPGKLVLVCKVAKESAGADADGFVHAVLNAGDPREPPILDAVLRYPAATHVLDFYSGKTMPKLDAFTRACLPSARGRRV